MNKIDYRRLYPVRKWAKKNANINFVTVAGIVPHQNHHLTFKTSMAMCCASVSHEWNNNENKKNSNYHALAGVFHKSNLCALFLSILIVFSAESRETAYIHAINAASLAWSITRACSRGDLTECSCDNSIRRKQRKWQWGGCSEVYDVHIILLFLRYTLPHTHDYLEICWFGSFDIYRCWKWSENDYNNNNKSIPQDINYGVLFSRRFIDSQESNETAAGLMNLHNNEAGRRVRIKK